MDSDKVGPLTAGDESPLAATDSPRRDRCKVWPAFAVVAAAVALAIAAQIVVALVLVGRVVARGGELDPDAIQQVVGEFFLSPVGFVMVAALGELAFLGSVLVATRLLPGSRADQVGLTRPRLPASSYITFVAGTGVPVAVGTGLSWLLSLLIEPAVDPTLIWARITPITFLPYVLFIALGPGFVEEITFRGFVQRRLLRRWSPRAAIAWSALLFALVHMDPHTIVFTFPIGVWLGVIAWRLGVIWPGIACHAALNGLWSAYFIVTVKTPPSAGFHVASAVVVGAVSIVGFAASLRILRVRS